MLRFFYTEEELTDQKEFHIEAPSFFVHKQFITYGENKTIFENLIKPID